MKVIPIPRWLREYRAPSLRLDIVAGLSLAAFAIPESLAYASLAELPPVSGLYCYLVAGIAYALFGTSRQLAVGPTSALAIAVATGIAALGGGDTARVVALGAGIALLVGLIGLGGRFLGLANVAYFLSDTVVTGFKTGPPSISHRRNSRSSSVSKAFKAASLHVSPIPQRVSVAFV